MTFETVYSGQTPIDVATDFANREVYAIVKEKWDRLALVKDNKGAKKRQPTPAQQRASASQTHMREVSRFYDRVVLKCSRIGLSELVAYTIGQNVVALSA